MDTQDILRKERIDMSSQDLPIISDSERMWAS
jgi:hypothetical protein